MIDTLRELQLAELEILRAIKKVCERNNIRFFLASGTLLGAVRHHGFIPWDDDIDIEMPYQDYQRFMSIAQEELGDGFFVQTSDTDPYYNLPYLRVQKTNTALLRSWEKNELGHYRIWIDVFPLADLGGKRDYKTKKLILKASILLLMNKTSFDTSKGWLTQRSSFFEYRLLVLARVIPEKIRRKVVKRLLKHVFRTQKTPDMTFVWTSVTRRIPREVYDEPDGQIWFEDDYYPVPKGYDKYLRILYKNYMQYPPEEKRKPRHDLFVSFDSEWTAGSDKRWDDIDWKVIKGQ